MDMIEFQSRPPKNRGSVSSFSYTIQTGDKTHPVSYLIVAGNLLEEFYSGQDIKLATYSHLFQPHYGPGVDSASNRNECQEYFLGGKDGRSVGLTNVPPSCADCLEIWKPQPPGTPSGPVQACNGIALSLITAISSGQG
jgi:hypothetical protein